MIFILKDSNSVANHFLAEMRDVEIQKDGWRFRKNLERVGELLAYELSKELNYTPHTVQTPLGKSSTYLIDDELVLITILRAGVPFYQGFLNFFDKFPSGFIGAYRRAEGEEQDIEIQLDYVTTPHLDGKVLIIVDPMLATGKSLIRSLKELSKFGKPKFIHIASVISAPEGIEYVNNNMTGDYKIWTGAIDKRLNQKAYIVPGLGDVGDLAFGPKL